MQTEPIAISLECNGRSVLLPRNSYSAPGNTNADASEPQHRNFGPKAKGQATTIKGTTPIPAAVVDAIISVDVSRLGCPLGRARRGLQTGRTTCWLILPLGVEIEIGK